MDPEADASAQAAEPAASSTEPSSEAATPPESTDDALNVLLDNQSGDGLPQGEAPAQPETSATSQAQPSQQLLAGRFKNVEEVVKGWKEGQSHIGKLSTRIKTLEAILKKAGIQVEDETDSIVGKVEKRILERINPLMVQSDQVRIDSAKSEVLKQFPNFDFKANNDKLCAEFDAMNREWVKKNPTAATLKAVRNILTDEQLMTATRQRAEEQAAAFAEGANGSKTGIPTGKSEADELVEMAQRESSIF